MRFYITLEFSFVIFKAHVNMFANYSDIHSCLGSAWFFFLLYFFTSYLVLLNTKKCWFKRFKTRTIEVMGVITFSLYEKTEKSAIICWLPQRKFFWSNYIMVIQKSSSLSRLRTVAELVQIEILEKWCNAAKKSQSFISYNW